LILAGSFIYGENDFEDSPYGLLEDQHYIFTIDKGYKDKNKLPIPS